jgi:hypothetical protein
MDQAHPSKSRAARYRRITTWRAQRSSGRQRFLGSTTAAFIRAISGIPERLASRALRWVVDAGVLVNRDCQSPAHATSTAAHAAADPLSA